MTFIPSAKDDGGMSEITIKIEIIILKIRFFIISSLYFKFYRLSLNNCIDYLNFIFLIKSHKIFNNIYKFYNQLFRRYNQYINCKRY